MSKTRLFPYRPSNAFLARLRSSGFTMSGHSSGTASRNIEAERLLQGQVAHMPMTGNCHLAAAILIGVIILAVAWPALAGDWELDAGANKPIARHPLWGQILQTIDRLPDAVLWSAIPLSLAAFPLLTVAIRLKSSKRKEQREKETGPMSDTDAEPTRLMIGGASRMGLIRAENQDAFGLAAPFCGSGALVVCDGVGGHRGGREAARFAVGQLTAALKRRDLHKAFSTQICARAIATTRRAFASDGISGLTTAIVVTISGRWLHYAVLGDGALTVIHGDGMIQQLLAPHHARGAPENVITAYLSAERCFTPRLGSVRLEPGAMVLAMSDGASDLLPVDWIADGQDRFAELIRTRGADWLAENLLCKVEAARDEETGELLHTDNMTLVIAALLDTGAPE